jgi:ribosomal protein S26
MVKRRNLNVNDRQLLKDFLLERVENGQLRRGSIPDGAVLVSVSIGMVSRLWRQWNVGHANALNGEWNVTSGKKANGRPVKYPRDKFVLAVREVPLCNRSTVRRLQGTLGVSKTTIHRMINKEKYCVHTPVHSNPS